MIKDIVEPPKSTSQHPVISPDLDKALSSIQKGAEERLEVLKSKKKEMEQGESSVETVPKLIRYIEKMEVDKDIEDEQEGDGDIAVAEGDVGGGQTADKGTDVRTTDVGSRQMANRGDIPDKEATKQTEDGQNWKSEKETKKYPVS